MDELLKTEEVATMLNVSRHTVLEYAKRGNLPHRRLGWNLYRFVRSEVEEWVAARARNVPAERRKRA